MADAIDDLVKGFFARGTTSHGRALSTGLSG